MYAHIKMQSVSKLLIQSFEGGNVRQDKQRYLILCSFFFCFVLFYFIINVALKYAHLFLNKLVL